MVYAVQYAVLVFPVIHKSCTYTPNFSMFILCHDISTTAEDVYISINPNWRHLEVDGFEFSDL